MKVQGRVETSEGFDEKMATHYYGRFALMKELGPLLEKTANVLFHIYILQIDYIPFFYIELL